MDVFFLLIFLAFVFVLLIGGVLYWAIMAGQFDNTEENASVILHDEDSLTAQAGSERNTSQSKQQKRKADVVSTHRL